MKPRHWETTLMGVFGLLAVLFQVVHNPAILQDQQQATSLMGQVTMALGLIRAGDANKV